MKKLTCLLSILLLLSLCFGACADDSAESPSTYAFTAGSVEIAIDAEANPLLKSLGACVAYDESPSCAFEGLDKTYTYAGFEIETYCLSNVDYIASIRILDDSVKTQKGITIGSDKASVLSAYGTPASETDTALIYETEGMKLQFLLREGVVSDIQYLKNEKSE